MSTLHMHCNKPMDAAAPHPQGPDCGLGTRGIEMGSHFLQPLRLVCPIGRTGHWACLKSSPSSNPTPLATGVTVTWNWEGAVLKPPNKPTGSQRTPQVLGSHRRPIILLFSAKGVSHFFMRLSREGQMVSHCLPLFSNCHDATSTAAGLPRLALSAAPHARHVKSSRQKMVHDPSEPRVMSVVRWAENPRPTVHPIDLVTWLVCGCYVTDNTSYSVLGMGDGGGSGPAQGTAADVCAATVKLQQEKFVGVLRGCGIEGKPRRSFLQQVQLVGHRV